MEHGAESPERRSVYLCNLLSDSYCDVECENVDDLCVDDICTDFVTDSPNIIPDIDLYLECTDDATYTVPSPSPCPPEVQTAIVAKNANFRISFPKIPEDNHVQLPSWECMMCGKSMKKESLKNKHLRDIHGVEKPFSCDLCKYGARCQKLLTRHYKRKHKLTNVSPQSIDDHKMAVVNNVDDKKQNSFMHENPKHLQRIIHDQEEMSTVCKTLRKPEELSENPDFSQGNVKRHSSMMAQKSVDNDFEFPNKEVEMSLEVVKLDSQKEDKSSFNTVHISKQVDCFPKRSGIPVMTKHVADVNDKECLESVFKCSLCDYTGSKKKLLKIHIQTMHDTNRKEYKCKICNYKCKQNKYFIEHTKKHQGELSHCCKICSKLFVSERALKRHHISHLEERRYLCSAGFCEKQFKSISALTDHKRNVHKHVQGLTSRRKRTKNIKCSEEGCDRWFRDNYDLKVHLHYHRGEKTRKCTKCDYRCIQKSSIDWHQNAKHHIMK